MNGLIRFSNEISLYKLRVDWKFKLAQLMSNMVPFLILTGTSKMS